MESSRELNPLEPDDRALLTGLPRGQVLDAPHKVLVGVFVQAQNVASRPHRAVAGPRLLSAEGDSFLPLPAPCG
ncbi:MAG TPA: hypothetical protein VES79_09980 [Solirubrobacteraceae bacterium]|nr:hypothetical protein [Solirubrobacteraceae bacterium]